jgi:hypothetical protein
MREARASEAHRPAHVAVTPMPVPRPDFGVLRLVLIAPFSYAAVAFSLSPGEQHQFLLNHTLFSTRRGMAISPFSLPINSIVPESCHTSFGRAPQVMLPFMS